MLDPALQLGHEADDAAVSLGHRHAVVDQHMVADVRLVLLDGVQVGQEGQQPPGDRKQCCDVIGIGLCGEPQREAHGSTFARLATSHTYASFGRARLHSRGPKTLSSRPPNTRTLPTISMPEIVSPRSSAALPMPAIGTSSVNGATRLAG